MNHPLRRRAVLGWTLAASGGLLASTAAAQGAAFPSRPLRMVVPFPPGGIADIAARSIGAEMAKDLGQPVVVENRPGAGGNVGAEAVAKAPPDGHTVLYAVASAFTANPHLYGRMPFDPLKDLVPVTETVLGGMVLVVRPDFKAGNLRDWLAQVRSQPGRLSYASYGNGSFPHLNMELLKSMTGTHVVHIPYRGAAPAMQDLLAGQVDMMFDQSATAIAQIRAGKVKPLAVNTPQRMAALPDVPTIGELLKGFDGSGWQGIWVPAGTPTPVIQRLNQSVVKALAVPDVRKRFTDAGLEVVGSTPEQTRQKVERESAKWKDVIDYAKIKVD
ncbi:MAG TPA: tripartite tricarboxylate transporter substrate binding protein [Ramlibacter sp.]|nr:tripartite tricarboxylate transporter substrate binding protein [Ramlibacter sp.]